MNTGSGSPIVGDGSETIARLQEQALQRVSEAQDEEQLSRISVEYLGKKGAVTELLKAIKNIPAEQRREFGNRVNRCKEEIDAAIAARRSVVLELLAQRPLDFDITIPGVVPARGSLHPILQTMDELNAAFAGLGFEIYEGPEVSSEAYCFDSLNFPAEHPARASMDTYWLRGSESEHGVKRLALRPHLTGLSVRYMQQHKPPFRFVYPGRAYRNEATDASHERAFWQYEALIVDREVPFSAGRLLVNTILETVFGRPVTTRMRAGFFPFVEPGFEIDMQCLVCGGKGCSVCKHVGWLEVMPGGPPHPNVLRAGGIDPAEWQGFYINIGLDRITMMRHDINDIRLFAGADLRFLKQF